jgi:hypothetical protein
LRCSLKHFVALAAGTVTLGLGVGAYAYFTDSGTGSGAASVGKSTAIQLAASTSEAIYPGTPGVDVNIVVTNPGNAAQHIGTVSLASVDAPSGCSTAAFTMTPALVNATIAPGGTTTAHSTLVMADSGNQDACQNGALTLHLSSN